jgi:hypothetical protein
MANKKLGIVKWGSRTHLAGLTVILVYGATVGDLTAAYSHTAIAVLFNPAFVGISMAMSGTALSRLFSMESTREPEQTASEEDIMAEDDNIDFLDDGVKLDSIESDESIDDLTYQMYGYY